MGSICVYHNPNTWKNKIVEQTNTGVKIEIGECDDYHVEPIYKFITNKDWQKIQSGEYYFITQTRNRYYSTIYITDGIRREEILTTWTDRIK